MVYFLTGGKNANSTLKKASFSYAFNYGVQFSPKCPLLIRNKRHCDNKFSKCRDHFSQMQCSVKIRHNSKIFWNPIKSPVTKQLGRSFCIELTLDYQAFSMFFNTLPVSWSHIFFKCQECFILDDIPIRQSDISCHQFHATWEKFFEFDLGRYCIKKV